MTSPDEQSSSFAEPAYASGAETSGAVALPDAATPVVLPSAVRAAAPGWYVEQDNPGVLRYWNGVRWEDWRKPLVEAPSIDQGQKSVGIAYLLALLVGGLGIHHFYLGRTGPAIAMLILWILGVLTVWIFVGSVLLFAVGVWLIVDLFLIPGYVRSANLRAVGHRR